MLTADASFTTQVDGVDQTVACQFTIDLPVLGEVDLTNATMSVSLTGQMSTNLPDQVITEAGLSTVGGTVTVGGFYDPTDETKSLWWLLNPDNPDSPLYRQDIRGSSCKYLFGFPPADLLPAITGTITSFRVAHDARSVEFDVTEQVDGWGNLPATPAVVTVSPWNAGLTSEFVMDAIIRSQQGISTWPATRANCLLSVGLRTSLWPEVGALDTTAIQFEPTFAAAEWGSGLVSVDVAGIGLTAVTPYVLAAPAGNDVHFEFFVTDAAAAVTPTLAVSTTDGTTAKLTVSIDPTDTIKLSVTASGTVRTLLLGPITAGVHKVNVLVNWPVGSTTVTATAYVDGVQVGTGSVTAAAARSATAVQSGQLITAITGGTTCSPLFGVQITGESAPTITAFTPAAILDRSLNPLTVCPAIAAGTAAWTELQTIAQAELGYIRRDAFGVIRFSNRDTLTSSAIVATVKSDVALKSLNTDVPAKVTYDRVQVPYTPWNTDTTAGLVWQANSKISIPANSTITITRNLTDGQVAAAIDTNVALLGNSGDPTDGGSYYLASRDKNGIDVHGNLTITAQLVSSAAIAITIQNTGGFTAWLVVPSTYSGPLTAGTPALWIGGVLATAGDELQADVGTGTNVLTLDSNAYSQDGDTAQDVASFVQTQVSVPRREFTDVAIVPRSDLEIGDKIGLDWPDAFIDEYAQIWGREFTASFPEAGESGGQWDMSLTVRTLGPPGAWLLGIAGRSEVGATTWIP